MQRILLPLMGMALLAPYAPAQDPAAQSEVPSITEPATAIAFPELLTVPGTRETHRLAGLGVRTKSLFNVKMYAMGLYVEVDGACKSLAKWRDASASKMQTDEKFFRELKEGEFSKSLRLVLARDVDGEELREAFDDNLEPRVLRAAREMKDEGAGKALESFRKLLVGDGFKEGTEFIFTWRVDGTLVVSMKGKVLGEVASPGLCWALFDVYLGRAPLSKSAKRHLVEQMPAVLKRQPHRDAELKDAIGNALDSIGG